MTALSPAPAVAPIFERGDHVTVGRYGEVHWVIQHIVDKTYAILRSPMSGKTLSATLNLLTMHTKGHG